MDLQSRTETRLRFLPQEEILYWLMSSIDLDIWNEKVVVNGYTSQVNFTENTHPKFRSNRYECTVVLPNLNYERNDVPQEFHQTDLNAFIGELIRKDRNISTEKNGHETRRKCKNNQTQNQRHETCALYRAWFSWPLGNQGGTVEWFGPNKVLLVALHMLLVPSSLSCRQQTA